MKVEYGQTTSTHTSDKLIKVSSMFPVDLRQLSLGLVFA